MANKTTRSTRKTHGRKVPVPLMRRWYVAPLIAAAALLPVLFIILTSSPARPAPVVPTMGPVTYSCSQLPKNELFDSVYGKPSPVKLSDWREWGKVVQEPAEIRIPTVQRLMEGSQGTITSAAGKWLTSHSANYRYSDDLVAGFAVMGVITDLTDNRTWLEVSRSGIREFLNIDIAIFMAHESIHYSDALTGTTDPTQHLCEEMRAFAFETSMYSEFTIHGYTHDTIQKEYDLLFGKLGGQWQSFEWAEYVRSTPGQ